MFFFFRKFIHFFPPKKVRIEKQKFILLKMIYSFIHSIRLKITIFATLSWAISNFHSNPKTKSTTFFFVSLFLKWLYMWILIRSVQLINQSINQSIWSIELFEASSFFPKKKHFNKFLQTKKKIKKKCKMIIQNGH